MIEQKKEIVLFDYQITERNPKTQKVYFIMNEIHCHWERVLTVVYGFCVVMKSSKVNGTVI